MKKFLFAFVLFALINSVKSQKIASSRWNDLFSYNNVLQIREDNGKLIAATENGIFYYTPSSGEITKLSKANGLHEVKISAFDYNPETKTGLIGYVNGTMDVIKEDGITYVVDIPLATGYTGNKKINHISITGNRAVISVDYGVSIYNLDRKEFGDTSFFINSGSYEPSKEAIIKDNTVFAITPSGVKKHEIGVTFPIYSGWADVVTGDFKHIDTDGSLIAFASNTQIYYGDGTTFSTIAANFSNIKDITINSGNIAVTNVVEDSQNNTFQSQISVYNNGNLNASITKDKNLNSAWYSNGNIYAASVLEGVLDAQSKSYKPDGPYNNRSYKVFLMNDKLWIASGIYFGLTPTHLGYYHFDGQKWVYPEYFKLNPNKFVFNITDIAVNPSNPAELFFTNSVQKNPEKGIFRMENDQFKEIYNEPHINFIRVPINVKFDENNQLFSTKLWTEFNNNGWGANISMQYFNKSSNKFEDYSRILSQEVINLYMNNGIAYISSPNELGGGLVLYRYNKTTTESDDVVKVLSTENNLPQNGTICSITDKNDDLWIGSTKGLRVLRNPISAINDLKPQTQPIIIQQRNIGEELFRDSRILSIAVDSGNNKWISVDNGGVFYISENGERTIENFTKENSPLPNNNITDIKINENNGEVYFVSRDGVVTYRGNVSNVSSDFGEVLVYPNPVVYANYKGNVKINGLAERTNIRITDAAGNLVHQAVARGGTYQWDLTNRGQRVASGIYFVLMTNEAGTDKATAKIAVVN